MKKIVSLALAAAATFAATPASAANVEISNDGSYRIAVPYGDLNLATSAGIRTLEGRMRAATNSVCNSGQPPSLSELRAFNACRLSISEAARPQIALAQRGAAQAYVVSEGR